MKVVSYIYEPERTEFQKSAIWLFEHGQNISE